MRKFIIATVLFLSVLSQSAYATIGFATNPNMRIWNAAGTSLLLNGYVVTCVPGTTCGCTFYTGKTTYTDATGATPNSNPVILDATGQASIWYDGLAKLTACSSTGVLQWTRDNVPSISIPATVTVSEWSLSSATPTYIAATQFSVLGDYTSSFVQGRRIKITQPGSSIYATVVTSSYLLGTTTVTIAIDSGVLSSSLTAISLSILEPTYLSSPIQVPVLKVGDYTITSGDCRKTLYAAPTTTSTVITFTVPTANTVPSGCVIITKNTGTGTVRLSGTIDESATTDIGPAASAVFSSNSTSWFFISRPTNSISTAHQVPRADTSGKISNTWLSLITDTYVVSEITSSGAWTVPADINDDGDMFFFASGGGACGGTGDINGGGGGGGEGGKIWYHKHSGMVSGASYTATIGAGGVSTGAAGKCADGTATSLVLSSDATGTVFSLSGGTGGYSGATGVAGSAGVFSALTTTAFYFTPEVHATNIGVMPGALGVGTAGGQGGGRLSGAGGATGAGNPGLAATGGGSGGGGGGYSAGAVNNGGNGYKGHIWYIYFRKITY